MSEWRGMSQDKFQYIGNRVPDSDGRLPTARGIVRRHVT